MITKTVFGRLLLLSLIALLPCSIVCSQKPMKCETKQNGSTPKHKVAGYERGKDSSLLLRISLNSDDMSQANLTSLAKRVKAVYCNESEIIVTFFDDYKAAKYFTFNDNSVYFEKGLEASWAEYYLNRTTLEEFLSFTTSRGYLKRSSKSRRIKVAL